MTDTLTDRTTTAQLLYNYDHAPTTVDPATHTATVEIPVVRVPGMPDLILDRPDPDEVIHWASLTADGSLTRHETANRWAFDPTGLAESTVPGTHLRWIQWPLIIALYTEALDPTGHCRAAHGYHRDALTFHHLGDLRGTVVQGCRRCSDDHPPNTVASALVRAMGGPTLALTGTIAWLGQWNDCEPGGPHGHNTLGDEEFGVLSGIAHTLRATPGRP
ncbi:hypothetical protein [Actinokineospora diospyrosa]|uniref:Uncharacterized protein n=1 Tax=Actinokineospora diospyrosa TaxID=103728 RepID=A0ABT1INZ6_9PSEU|nr:hypothetical protein [Actinokineospora diospyrosa]MCP2274191.1 hypothetical protein [Actinokineospora diospyrosa]